MFFRTKRHCDALSPLIGSFLLRARATGWRGPPIACGRSFALSQPPFRYRALAPEDIAPFVPLTETTAAFGGKALLDHYLTDPNSKHLKPYVPIIYDSPVYPVIYDAADTVLSLPPIINSRHSRIQPHTKDVFIECTATDLTKANVVLDTVVTMFSEHCATPFTVEPVDVAYLAGDPAAASPPPGAAAPAAPPPAVEKTAVTPVLSTRMVEADLRDIRTMVGVDELTPEVRRPRSRSPTRRSRASPFRRGGKAVPRATPLRVSRFR